MTLRTLAAVAAGLLLTGPLSAQDGRVLDPLSGAGIAFAELYWLPGRPDADPVARIETDLSGHFSLPDDWRAPGWVQVRSLGFRPLLLSFQDASALAWTFVLDADPLELESVLITAGARGRRRSEIAIPIAEVTSEEIRISGAASADQLLDELPGLQAMPTAPVGSTIQIRGIGDARVLVLIDGQPANGALLENRDLSRISLSGVQRVEVVKGPLSTLYGSDALGGVINVITQAPEAGLRAEARALSGSGGRYEGDFTVSGGGPVVVRATGSWRQQQQVPGLDGTADAFARVWDVRSTVRAGDSDGVRARADISYLRERQRWPVGGGFSGFNDNEGLTGWGEVTIPGLGGDWTARLLAQGYEHLFRRARGTAPISGNDEEKQVEDLWKATVLHSRSFSGHQLDLGIEGSRRSIESPDKILEDKAADDQFEVFGQDAWTLGSTTVTGGVRGTFNDRWGNAVSPTLGVTTISGSDLRLRALVGRGFRAPSFKELAWDFANIGAGYTVQGSPDLEPERSWNVTAGIDWAPSARLTLGFEAYTNQITNLIETSFIGNNPSGLLIFSPRNLSEARTRGFEVSSSGQFGTWDARAEYVLLDARSLEDGVPLDRRAKHSGRMRLGRTFPVLDGLRAHVTTVLTGAAPIVAIDEFGQRDELGTQERFVSVDVQGTLQLPRGVHLVFGVTNLLDARPDGWQAVIERQFRLGLEARDLF